MTDVSPLLAILGFAGGVASTAFGVVLWLGRKLQKFDDYLEKITETREELKSFADDMREELKRLNEVPVLTTRVGQVEQIVKAQGDRIERLWDRVFSMQKMRAVTASRPSFGDDE